MIKNWHSKLDTTYPNFQTQLSFMNVYIEAHSRWNRTLEWSIIVPRSSETWNTDDKAEDVHTFWLLFILIIAVD